MRCGKAAMLLCSMTDPRVAVALRCVKLNLRPSLTRDKQDQAAALSQLIAIFTSMIAASPRSGVIYAKEFGSILKFQKIGKHRRRAV
jgi:hypothetical protein